MSNLFTVQIEATPGNQRLITEVVSLVVNGGGTVTGQPNTTGADTSPKKEDKDLLAEVKKAAKKAKAGHGEDFVKEVVDSLGGTTKGKTYLQSVASLDTDAHQEFIDTVSAGPQTEEASDEPEDDEWEDDEDDEEGESELDAETVRDAVKAYKAENGMEAAKKVLKKFGTNLAGIDNLDSDDLEGLFKAVS